VPGISFYPVGGGHHGPDEWLSVQAFNQFHQIITRYVEEIAKTAATLSHSELKI
jgi:di/tripeptidase